jgi:hypothetical protein
LLLPILTVLLTAIMSEEGMADWGTFWAALEALGTTAAFIAVVYLAWSERSKDRRRAERIAAAIRTLLKLEIERNLKGLHWYVIEIPSDFGRFNYSAFIMEGVETYTQTKDRLEERLDLYANALDAHEIMKVNDFYKKLSQLKDARQTLRSTGLGPQILLNVTALDRLEGLVSREEFAALEERKVADVVFYAMKQLYTAGQEIARSLEIGRL